MNNPTADPKNFAKIVEKYQGRVIRLCASIVGESNAEDAAQEIFIKVYESLDEFKDRSAFSTWLYRIVYNHALDLLRKEKRRRAESWDALVEAEGEKIHRLVAAPPPYGTLSGSLGPDQADLGPASG